MLACVRAGSVPGPTLRVTSGQQLMVRFNSQLIGEGLGPFEEGTLCWEQGHEGR